jgi:N-carbamoyl-L-amino-acid hydrolase
MLNAAARFGATPGGGVTRLAASAEDGLARDWMARWLRAANLEVRVDSVGNLFGIADLGGRGAPLILCGSHLDTQPKSGRFDGTYGVLAAALAVAAIADGIRAAGPLPPRNLAVVSWTNEEGARFRPSTLGSSVYAGTLAAADALATRDAAGVTLAEALERIGYRGGDPAPQAEIYAELHVEQARSLERAGACIGVVTRNWAAYKYEIGFHGEQAHTGPTPMAERRDALYSAAELIVFVRRLPELVSGHLHTSVGALEVEPNSANVVPALAVTMLELRSPDPAILDEAEALLNARLAEIAAEAQVKVEMRAASRRSVRHFDERHVARAEAAARRCGYDPMRVETIAGHDAVTLLAAVPAILLFVPSRNGVTHNEAEFTGPEDLEAGLRVLTRLLWDLLWSA